MKTKIIEIIGPPGVGKSTIYNSLCKTWKPGSSWVYPDILLTAEPNLLSFTKWLLYHLRLLLGKKLTKTIPVDYGLRFASEHHELAEYCWELISGTPFSKRYRSIYFLFTTFCMYQAIAEKAAGKICVVDEGLLQKSFLRSYTKNNEEQAMDLLNKYLQLIPMPYAIIYIDTPDTSEIVKRLRGRNKIIASHFGKEQDALQLDMVKWQHVQQGIVKKMERAGVMIIKIDGKRPVKENGFIINQLLKEMGAGRDASQAFLAKPVIVNSIKR